MTLAALAGFLDVVVTVEGIRAVEGCTGLLCGLSMLPSAFLVAVVLALVLVGFLLLRREGSRAGGLLVLVAGAALLVSEAILVVWAVSALSAEARHLSQMAVREGYARTPEAGRVTAAAVTKVREGAGLLLWYTGPAAVSAAAAVSLLRRARSDRG